jgi:hypothetical protein
MDRITVTSGGLIIWLEAETKEDLVHAAAGLWSLVNAKMSSVFVSSGTQGKRLRAQLQGAQVGAELCESLAVFILKHIEPKIWSPDSAFAIVREDEECCLMTVLASDPFWSRWDAAHWDHASIVWTMTKSATSRDLIWTRAAWP